MLKKGLLIVILLTAAGNFFGQDPKEKVQTPHLSPALKFTENLGQWDVFIRYRAQLDGGQLYFEDDGLTYAFYDKRKVRAMHKGGLLKGMTPEIRCHAIKVKFLDADPASRHEAFEKGSDYENFFLGNDKSKWKSRVKNYHRIRYDNLYPNIDYEAITATSGIKYNFYVKPGGDVTKIRMSYDGATKLKLKNGQLIIATVIDSIVEHKPYAYQNINGRIKVVPCNYALKDNVLSFEFPKGFDPAYELVIDPVLIFSAQSGSLTDNFGMTGTYDQNGNLFSGGTAFYQGYPTTPGAYSTSFAAVPGQTAIIAGLTDVVITKYSSTGISLVYSTYLGGTGTEIVTSLITDAAGNLYLYGATSSTNFPTSGTPYDATFNGGSPIAFQFNGTSFNGGSDIYVSKFDASGSSLLASTYIGGSSNDGINYNNYSPPSYVVYPCWAPGGYVLFNEYPADSLQYNYGDQYRGEIQLDKNGNVYVASSTKSSDFPVVNAFQNSLNGKQDAVVFKLSNNLSTLIYSTYLGGSKNDAGYSIIVDDTLQAYVTGGTYSTDFPVVAGCYQTAAGGGKADGYLAKIGPNGNQLLKATYVGTSNYDQSYFVQSDRIGRIYIFGQSLGNMPVSPGVYSNPNSHQFLMRFNNQLTTLDKSTVFGSGSPTLDISPSAFSVDKCSGCISLSGWGGNFINCSLLNSMPITAGAFQASPPNGHDFYFMVLQPNFLGLKYGSYFGGNLSDEHVDGGTSRISESGVLYQSICAGCGGNQDFPINPPNAWPGTPGNPNHNIQNNNCNNGVVKFDYQPKIAAAIGTNTIAGCSPLTVTFTNLSSPGLTYLWNLGGGPNDTTSQILNPVKTFSTPGTYTVTLLEIEKVYCNQRDSTQTIITVYPRPTPAFTASFSPCSNTVSFVNNSSGTVSPNSYTWDMGDGSPTQTVTTPPPYTYTSNGVFTISLIAGNSCTAQATQTVSLFNFTPAVNSLTMCSGDNASLTASGGTSYTWTPATGLSNTNTSSPAVTATANTIYTVQINNNSTGNNCSQTLTTSATVYPKPTAVFATIMNPCGGGVNFFDSSTPNISSWQWTLSPSATSTLQNPYYFYSNGGTNTVILIVTTGDGCKDTAQQVITVTVPPPVSVSGNSLVCLGTKVQLSASGGTAYSWTPASSLDVPSIATPVASPIISTQYSVTISTGNNCSFLLTTNVGIIAPPPSTAYATANPTFVITGNSTQLTYNGPSGLSVSWLPVGTTTPSTGYTVSASPSKPTTYTAMVSNGACGERATVLVEAYTEGCIDKDVFVPNTFTPNGDGQNDILYVRGLKVEEVYFAVYNRWGEMVFETNDKTKGWDGVYKGRAADVGVFGWYLRVKCFNGEETFRKGDVTLIR